jgi:hypothetical protein
MEYTLKQLKNQLTRRSFLHTAAIGGLPAILGTVEIIPAVTGSQNPCLPVSKRIERNRISNALVNHVGRELVNVSAAIQSRGSVDAEDIRKTASGMELFFAHLAEIELTPVLDQQMRKCGEALLDFKPQQKQLLAMQDWLASVGASVRMDRLQAMFSLPYERKVDALMKIQRQGIDGCVEELLVTMEQLASRRSSSRTLRVRFSQQEEMCKAMEQAIGFLVTVAAILVLLGLGLPAGLVSLLIGMIAIVESLVC